MGLVFDTYQPPTEGQDTMSDYSTSTLAAFQRIEGMETLAEREAEDMAEVLDASEPIDRLTDDEPTAYDMAWNADAEGMGEPVPCEACRGPVDAAAHYPEACGYVHPDCHEWHAALCTVCRNA